MTRLRCDGIFNDQFVTQSLLIPMIKECPINRSTFAEVMGKNQVSRVFFADGVETAFADVPRND